VLNRSDSRVGISADDVAATLGLPIAVSLPSSRSIPISVNEGRPVIVGDPKSPVARPLDQLVSLFTEEPAAMTGGFSWLRRSAR
jgi:pilus assembly protein CpaE